MIHDATLEEMWRIKEELSAPQVSWEEYAARLYAFQEEERKRGVKFVSFSTKRPEGSESASAAPCVAEAPAEYDAGAKPAESPSNDPLTTP